MSEHRRKPPQPQGGGRAAARRGQTGSSSGRRAAPRGATGSPSDSYGSGPSGSEGEERPYGGRAEARRAAQRGGGSRRRAAEPARGGRRAAPGGPNGPGRGRGRAAPPDKKRFIDYPRAGKYGAARWVPSWRLIAGIFLGFFGGLVAAAGIGYAMVGIPKAQDTGHAQNNVFYWSNGKPDGRHGWPDEPPARRLSPRSLRRCRTRWSPPRTRPSTRTTASTPRVSPGAVLNMAQGGETQGGSTITQQYVKNTFLSQEQTVTRKFKELFISIKVGTEADQGRDPRRLPQHRLLRPWRLRHPGGSPGVLRRGRPEAHPLAVRLPRGRTQGPELLRPRGGRGERTPRRRRTPSGPRNAWRGSWTNGRGRPYDSGGACQGRRVP